MAFDELCQLSRSKLVAPCHFGRQPAKYYLSNLLFSTWQARACSDEAFLVGGLLPFTRAYYTPGRGVTRWEVYRVLGTTLVSRAAPHPERGRFLKPWSVRGLYDLDGFGQAGSTRSA